MSRKDNNPFEEIISCVDGVLGKNRKPNFGAIDKHLIIPAGITIVSSLILFTISVFSKDYAELLLAPILAIFAFCLLYLFGVIVYSVIEMVKVFKDSSAIFNRAAHDYPVLEAMLKKLVKISYEERSKFVHWLENRVRQEYKIAGLFSVIYAATPKITKSITNGLGLDNPELVGRIELVASFLLIFGIGAILLTLLVNSFQKYIFYTQYSLDHGNNRKTQDI